MGRLLLPGQVPTLRRLPGRWTHAALQQHVVEAVLQKKQSMRRPADWPGQTVAGTRSMREQRLRSRCRWWACRCPKYRLKRRPKEVQGRRILGKTADGDCEAAAAAQTCALAVLKPGAIATASPNLSANPMASPNLNSDRGLTVDDSDGVEALLLIQVATRSTIRELIREGRRY